MIMVDNVAVVSEEEYSSGSWATALDAEYVTVMYRSSEGYALGPPLGSPRLREERKVGVSSMFFYCQGIGGKCGDGARTRVESFFDCNRGGNRFPSISASWLRGRVKLSWSIQNCWEVWQLRFGMMCVTGYLRVVYFFYACRTARSVVGCG